ncbi:methylated-DNA--[protein]-cysteine S-methyltransferase [Lentibacillus sp. N15]|uniref:methylated-DNA--[protein]-cysteine S-methyltransferase n=1 Tax=Lentibacillus songyuanensis TaxID=3136161 RepID=UPI0031BA2173
MKQNNTFVYWDFFFYESWRLMVAATNKGLCYVSPTQSFVDLDKWVSSRLPNARLIHDKLLVKPFTFQFKEYFQGRRKEFDFPIDIYGSPFQRLVWETLYNIPYGHMKSYSDVAEHLQKLNSFRAVGAAIGANPVLIAIPCHRVVGKDGRLTGYRGGLEMKQQLLQLEKNSRNIEKTMGEPSTSERIPL